MVNQINADSGIRRRSQTLRDLVLALKEVVAELTLENRLLKKSMTADGEDAA